jgi:hypothetical protein
MEEIDRRISTNKEAIGNLIRDIKEAQGNLGYSFVDEAISKLMPYLNRQVKCCYEKRALHPESGEAHDEYVESINGLANELGEVSRVIIQSRLYELGRTCALCNAMGVLDELKERWTP